MNAASKVRGTLLCHAGKLTMTPMTVNDIGALVGVGEPQDVSMAPAARRTLGLQSEQAWAEFQARIRLSPRTTITGVFELSAESAPAVITEVLEFGTVSEQELAAANRAGLEFGLARLRKTGVVPIMSAAEHLALIDEDDAPVPRP